MLSRQQVFELIEKERTYQDSNYNPDEKVSSGLTRRERDAEVSPGILMLEAYARKASDAWVNTKGTNVPALQQVAKLAAIAVRILERAGDSQSLLETGNQITIGGRSNVSQSTSISVGHQPLTDQQVAEKCQCGHQKESHDRNQGFCWHYGNQYRQK